MSSVVGPNGLGPNPNPVLAPVASTAAGAETTFLEFMASFAASLGTSTGQSAPSQTGSSTPAGSVAALGQPPISSMQRRKLGQSTADDQTTTIDPTLLMPPAAMPTAYMVPTADPAAMPSTPATGAVAIAGAPGPLPLPSATWPLSGPGTGAEADAPGAQPAGSFQGFEIPIGATPTGTPLPTAGAGGLAMPATLATAMPPVTDARATASATGPGSTAGPDSPTPSGSASGQRVAGIGTPSDLPPSESPSALSGVTSIVGRIEAAPTTSPDVANGTSGSGVASPAPTTGVTKDAIPEVAADPKDLQAAHETQTKTETGTKLEVADAVPEADDPDAPRPTQSAASVTANGALAAAVHAERIADRRRDEDEGEPAAISAHAAHQPTASLEDVDPAAKPAETQRPVPTEQVAAAIQAHAARGDKRFEIRLDPPELGRVDVRMNIGPDGEVRAHLIVERTETLDLMLRDQRSLERSLEQTGMKLGDNGLSFALRQDGGGGQQGRDTWRGGYAALQEGRSGAGDFDEPAMPLAAAGYARPARAGGLDLRV